MGDTESKEECKEMRNGRVMRNYSPMKDLVGYSHKSGTSSTMARILVNETSGHHLVYKGYDNEEVAEFDNEMRVYIDPLLEDIIPIPYGIYPEQGKDKQGRIITEYCPMGDLFELILIGQSIHPETVVRHIFIQLASNMKRFHDAHYVMRDFKLENVLMNDDGKFLMCDFNFVTKTTADPRACKSCRFHAGTEGYMAPELAKRDLTGMPTDIWCLGVALYVMLSHYPVSRLKPRWQLYERKYRGTSSDPFNAGETKVSATAIALVNRILNEDYRFRPTIDEILADPWIEAGSTLTTSVDGTKLIFSDGETRYTITKK